MSVIVYQFQTVKFIQMMSLTFGLFTQVSGSGPLGPLVFILYFTKKDEDPPFVVYFLTITGSSGCLSQWLNPIISIFSEVPVILTKHINGFLSFVSEQFLH